MSAATDLATEHAGLLTILDGVFAAKGADVMSMQEAMDALPGVHKADWPMLLAALLKARILKLHGDGVIAAIRKGPKWPD